MMEDNPRISFWNSVAFPFSFRGRPNHSFPYFLRNRVTQSFLSFFQNLSRNNPHIDHVLGLSLLSWRCSQDDWNLSIVSLSCPPRLLRDNYPNLSSTCTLSRISCGSFPYLRSSNLFVLPILSVLLCIISVIFVGVYTLDTARLHRPSKSLEPPQYSHPTKCER